MRLETKKRLLDAIEACEAIERRTTGMSLAAFLGNDTVRDVMLFRLLVIGGPSPRR